MSEESELGWLELHSLHMLLKKYTEGFFFNYFQTSFVTTKAEVFSVFVKEPARGLY